MNPIISPANGECTYYMTKACKKAIWLNPNDNFYLLHSLAKEMTRLARDSTKNEKIAFALRSVQDVGGQHVICDISVHFAKVDGELVTGKQMLEFAKQYYKYVQGLDVPVEPELVYCYYPYNPYDTNQEVSAEDKLVTWHMPQKGFKVSEGNVASPTDIPHKFIDVADKMVLH